MQIIPTAALDIRGHLELDDITHPHDNLRAGIYHFGKLMSYFQVGELKDRYSLSLAAYNAGLSRIYDAQELAAYMGLNPNSWNELKESMPFLSKRYYSLHESVWEENRPPNGYFGDSHQTIVYVKKVMQYYEEYCSLYPPA